MQDTESKSYTPEELSRVIWHSANAINELAAGFDKQNEALKEMVSAMLDMVEDIKTVHVAISNLYSEITYQK